MSPRAKIQGILSLVLAGACLFLAIRLFWNAGSEERGPGAGGSRSHGAAPAAIGPERQYPANVLDGGPGEPAAAVEPSPAATGWRLTGRIVKVALADALHGEGATAGEPLLTPAAEARVRAAVVEEDGARAVELRAVEAATGPDGRFELAGLAANASLRLEVDEGPWTSATSCSKPRRPCACASSARTASPGRTGR